MGRWQGDAAGRLQLAALELFSEQGYEATTVAEIAERAGLTKRTFFRHFADKREVLFAGSEELTATFVDAIAAAPEGTAMEFVDAAFDAIGALMAERLEFARTRMAIVSASPDVQERELIKLAKLKLSVADALVARGVDASTATFASETAMTVFHIGFSRWVAQDDPAAMATLMRESLAELRAVTSGR